MRLFLLLIVGLSDFEGSALFPGFRVVFEKGFARDFAPPDVGRFVDVLAGHASDIRRVEQHHQPGTTFRTTGSRFQQSWHEFLSVCESGQQSFLRTGPQLATIVPRNRPTIAMVYSGAGREAHPEAHYPFTEARAGLTRTRSNGIVPQLSDARNGTNL